VRWGVCTTVRATPEQVLAFAAHHLALGAEHVWVHLDDPGDPAAEALDGLKGVTAIRCDDAHWARMGRRPEKHQRRQVRNLARICRRSDLDFIGHFDVDEFLTAARPVSGILAEVPPDRIMLRAEPYEALHSPGLADDIFTARHFRRGLHRNDPAALQRLHGPHAGLLPKGMMSHTVGKCLFRTRLEGIEPGIHGARRGQERIDGGPFHPDLALLHFHAEDPARWRAGLEFRLTKGAYQYIPALQAFLTAAGPGEIDAFYHRVQTATPETLATLSGLGLLLTADLGLRAKVAALSRRRADSPLPPPHIRAF